MAAATYADRLKDVLRKHAAHKIGHGRIEALPVFDDERLHYSLVDVGWNQGGRIHSLIFFARIVDGKIRLEWDGIHYGIHEELIAAGVPEEDIVFAWREPCPSEAKRSEPRKPIQHPHTSVAN